MGWKYLFDSLMSNSLDEPGVMYPLLAEKVTYDPNRPNMSFSTSIPKHVLAMAVQ